MSTPLPRLVFVVGSQFQGGHGDRREDCANIERCTTAWARFTMRQQSNASAHCDPRCPSLEVVR